MKLKLTDEIKISSTSLVRKALKSVENMNTEDFNNAYDVLDECSIDEQFNSLVSAFEEVMSVRS